MCSASWASGRAPGPERRVKTQSSRRSVTDRRLLSCSEGVVLGQRAAAVLLRPPGGEGEALHGGEDLLPQVGVVLGEGADELLDLLALGVAVGGAGVEDHRQFFHFGGLPEHPLRAVEEGTDLGDAHAVQVGHRLEAGEPPLVEEGEEEGLDGVVEVVAQGDLGDAPVPDGVVESAPAHFGAHGAGVLLLPQVEDDVVDLRGEEGVGDAQLLAVGRHRGEVHALAPVHMAHVQGEGLHGEGLGVKLRQLGQGGQEGEGVLAAGDPHGDPVAGLDHVVVLHTAAGVAQNSVQHAGRSSLSCRHLGHCTTFPLEKPGQSGMIKKKGSAAGPDRKKEKSEMRKREYQRGYKRKREIGKYK